MKKRNYMLKFGLSMLVIILPILALVYGILIWVFYKDMDNPWGMILSFSVGILAVFLVSLLIGFLLYKKTNYEMSEDATTITNGLVIARKKDITKIKARRFIFLYSYDVYCKPWAGFAFLSYYFYSKDELTKFVKRNSFLMEFIREKDLKKLDLR